MTGFVALLRAVNVGGTGKFPMTELKAMCEAAGFGRVKTYIASGNVVFASSLPEAQVKSALETRLADYAGKPVGVLVRTAKEMAAVLAANPFRHTPPNRTVAIFLDEAPGRHAGHRRCAGRRGGRPRSAGNLCPLPAGTGHVQAEAARRQARHGAQHQQRGQARPDGGGALATHLASV
jgi:hypothetical protein